MVKLINLLHRLLNEGGAGGHLEHPFEFASTGAQLASIFAKTIASLKKGGGSVKIDGINASLRLVDDKFVIDRGSAKPLDLKGVRPEDLENRFGAGHDFIKIGSTVIQIFDASLSTCKPELARLGMLNNPNILLNIEYVEGQSNVIGYGAVGNFLAIHGLKEIVPKSFNKDGSVKSRVAKEIPYDTGAMDAYINKLNSIALKYGFKVLGSVDTVFKRTPKLTGVLNSNFTLYPDGKPVTKSLKDWLKQVKSINKPLITIQEFLRAKNSKNISQDFVGQDIQKVINDTVVYIATIALGDEILNNTTSELGDLQSQEGIVVRDTSIHNKPFKITGNFIIKGLESKFRK